jgi:hypothetical protein
VIDAAPLGVDRSAATFVTDVLREAVGRLGFQVIPTQELYAAARDLSLGFPPSPEAVFQLEEALRAPVAVTAEVRAARRQYLVRLRVRVAVENQERVRDLTAGQFELGDALREALPALLVPPQTPVAAAETPGPPPPRRVRRLRVHPRRWELGGGAVVAFGPGRDSFVNALLFARAAYYVSDRLGFTGSISYANLRGRQGRVSNALFLVGVETAVDLVPQSRIFIPLRLELGYLPANGPVARITAGLSFPLARRVRLEVDLVSPTLWVLPETSPVSLDLAASMFFSL